VDYLRDSGRTLRALRLDEATEADAEAACIGETWSVLSVLESWVKEGSRDIGAALTIVL
jgi:hypothetical protein